MKRKIFTLLLCVFLGNMAMAQGSEAVIKKAEVAPVIDGKMDAVWYGANTYNIAVSMNGETPTLGPVGTTTWKGLWTDEGIYIFLTVNDDVWYPSYISGGNHWEHDKPELYFDVNAVKIDGKGPLTDGNGGGNGHYQVAPASELAKIDGTSTTQTDGVVYSFLVADPAYSVEYFIPFSKLVDEGKVEVNKTAPIGFDVTIIDRDDVTPGRLRNNWSNNGSINESWNNMDGCGTVTLSAEIAEPGTVVVKAAAVPVIDGVADPIWATANTYNIDKPFQKEVPTVGMAGETTWKAMWDDKGMYVLVTVNDDVWDPSYLTAASDNYNYDKPEIYFDVNTEKKDGLGPNTSNSGHFQVAPASEAAKIDGVSTTQDDGVQYAFKVTDPSYVVEYFVPWDKLVDKTQLVVDKSIPMGFDVTINDRDDVTPGRQRAVWSNIGEINESWNNMDGCATVIFEGAAAVEVINIESIAITGGQQITTDNGTLQFSAVASPADATQKYKWKITNGTGQATINKDGLVKAIRNGTVTVEAVSFDDFISSNPITVTISGQVVTHFESSYIKDGDFTLGTGTAPGADWSGGAVIEDGIATLSNPTAGVNPWDWTFGQTINVPVEAKELAYVLQFKAWADEARIFDVDLENVGGNYVRFGDTTDPRSPDGKSQWRLDLTTEPTIYTFKISSLTRMDPANPQQKFNLFAGMATPKVYVDSVFLVNEADFALSAKELAANTMKVYPNPVGSYNELTVSLATLNARVSIYNAMGQKLMEKTANGNVAKFNVTSLRKGMYFVRLDNGTTQKFVR